MISFSRFSRALTIFLCLFYIFTGSGLDKLTYQCVSLIHRSVIFPCEGKGCQCDSAGYELPNCQCKHDEGVSCCSSEMPIEEETCCSEKESDYTGETISSIPCQGIEDDSTHTLASHLILLPALGKIKNVYIEFSATPYIQFPKDPEKFSIDKIPIFS